MSRLLALTAVLEAGTGLVLLVYPEVIVGLIIGGGPQEASTLTIGRVAGVALSALGVACWLARSELSNAAGLVKAMGLYNLGVVLVLAAAGLQTGTVGIMLWPVVIVHAAMAAWCLLAVMRKPA